MYALHGASTMSAFDKCNGLIDTFWHLLLLLLGTEGQRLKERLREVLVPAQKIIVRSYSFIDVIYTFFPLGLKSPGHLHLSDALDYDMLFN